MKPLRALCGALAVVLVGSSVGAFVLAIYLGSTRPTVATPDRVRKLHYHSTTVYLTVIEDRWLVGLFWTALCAAVLLYVIDRWLDPFGRHSR